MSLSMPRTAARSLFHGEPKQEHKNTARLLFLVCRKHGAVAQRSAHEYLLSDHGHIAEPGDDVQNQPCARGGIRFFKTWNRVQPPVAVRDPRMTGSGVGACAPAAQGGGGVCAWTLPGVHVSSEFHSNRPVLVRCAVGSPDSLGSTVDPTSRHTPVEIGTEPRRCMFPKTVTSGYRGRWGTNLNSRSNNAACETLPGEKRHESCSTSLTLCSREGRTRSFTPGDIIRRHNARKGDADPC